ATPGSYDPSYNGNHDAFVARLDFALPPLLLTASALNSPAPRGGVLRFRTALTNSSPDPFSGDLVLHVEHQGGFAASRLLVSNTTLASGQTAVPTFSLRIPPGVPFGLYTGTVTALEGGTSPLAEGTFSF